MRTRTPSIPPYEPGLLNLARRLAHDDADDLVQSTWLRALQHPEPVHKPRSWLRRVLVNEHNMAVRSRIRRTERELAAVHEHDPSDPEDLAHEAQVARLVHELVDALDEDTRLVVRERYFEGSSAADIARRHTIPAGTVRWRLKQGLDRLRRQLDAHYGGRRALWAGALMPVAPTLTSAAASTSSRTAAASSATAGKGTSTMTLKMLTAAALFVSGTAGAAAYVSSLPPEPTTTPTARASTASSVSESSSRHEAASPTPESTDARARWDRLRRNIQAASTREPAAARPSSLPAAIPSGSNSEQVHEEFRVLRDRESICVNEDGDVRPCPPPDEAVALSEEVMQMVESCTPLMADTPDDLSLHAHVIGAPDVGAIVDSVELSTDSDEPTELARCLRESMYTLDLGPVERPLDQTLEIQLGSRMELVGNELDIEKILAGEALPEGVEIDEQTRAQLERALASTDRRQIQVIRIEQDVSEREPSAP